MERIYDFGTSGLGMWKSIYKLQIIESTNLMHVAKFMFSMCTVSCM